MKREQIGLALLLGLLVLGLLTTWYMGRTHEKLADRLESAQTLALAENWEGAERLVRSARKDWEDNRHFSAALTEHAALEEIDSLFSQLKVYAQRKEALAYAAACAQIASYLEDLGDAQDLTWWNLL